MNPPPCICLGEWLLVVRDINDDGGRLVFRWVITWANPDCSFLHEADGGEP